MPKTKHPVETKVVAATGAAAGGSTFAAFLVWLLGVTVWGAPNDAGHADTAVLAVPTPVAVLVVLAATSGITALAGYLTKHTHRDDAGMAGTEVALLVMAGSIALIALVYTFGRP